MKWHLIIAGKKVFQIRISPGQQKLMYMSALKKVNGREN